MCCLLYFPSVAFVSDTTFQVYYQNSQGFTIREVIRCLLVRHKTSLGVDVDVRSQNEAEVGEMVCSLFSLSLLFWGVCILESVADWEGGVSQGRFKLLSVNVSPCYLDSNYTCQLSLSPHLSFSLSVSLCLPLHFCSATTVHSFSFLSLFICNLPLCHSVLPSVRFSTPLESCIHCCLNPLRFISPHTMRKQKVHSWQIEGKHTGVKVAATTAETSGLSVSDRLLWQTPGNESQCMDVWISGGWVDGGMDHSSDTQSEPSWAWPWHEETSSNFI